ncbi:MAG: cytochrome c oxidase assembly protein [Cellvibrionales bacterium]|nr:cytochrome c oxidase assembly protein [Cellvibrionales bacterium]
MVNVDKEGDRFIVVKLLGLTAVMFAFAVWVMPPFYYLLCDLLDIDYRTNDKAYQAEAVQVDRSRAVKVQFVASNNEGMQWEFRPNEVRMDVHPGEVARTLFFARNPTGKQMVAQAVPSILPTKAAEYFHKTECFCFNQQILEAGQAVDMPLVFIVDQALPADIHTITLSYALFDVTDAKKPDATPAPDKNAAQQPPKG